MADESPIKPPLNPQTVLSCAPEVTLGIANNSVFTTVGGSRVDAGRFALVALELFRRPQSMADALQQYSQKNATAQEWMEVSKTIVFLYSQGILRDASLPDSTEQRTISALGAVHTQVRMLNDETRTSGFLRAIEQTVKLGDVVLDIGTGTGILAIGAAKAGAKHVYAIESSALADVARRMVEDNGMTAAVTVIQGWSHEVELPQKANVLVSETVGDGAMGERILESVLDARRRLLTPDAKIIPRSIKVGVAAVSLTPALLDHYTFSADNVAKWNADYEMDFKSLKDIEPDPDRLTPYRMRTRDYSSCTPLGKPLWLATVELASFAEPLLHSSATLEVNRDGYLHGLVLFFELELSGGEKLSTAPAGTPGSAISSDCHWRIPLWLRAQPLKVTAGDDFQITFDYSLGISRLRMRSAPPSLNV